MISNLVTTSRIVLLAPLAWLILRGDDAGHWIALAVFLLAGLTDVLDGWLARRLGEVSALGALLDLTADRLLTLTVVVTLMAAGVLTGWSLAAGALLIARDLIVASFGEALPGRLGIKVTLIERVKIGAQFTAFGLLIVPAQAAVAGVSLATIGHPLLIVAAVLSLETLSDYSGRVARAVRPD